MAPKKSKGEMYREDVAWLKGLAALMAEEDSLPQPNHATRKVGKCPKAK